MRTLLIRLAFSAAFAALPPTADAHVATCNWGDAPCAAACILTHHLEPEGDHHCAFVL